MEKLNKEIAVLYPFKIGLSKHIKPKKQKKDIFVDVEEIKRILPPLVKIKTNGNSVGENVYKILTHPKVKYGPLGFAQKSRNEFIKQINLLNSKKNKLTLYIAGFPHKMPNPLFTTHLLPDLGELMVLWRLESLANRISLVYKNGVEVVVCIETSVFPHLAKVSKNESGKYANKLHELQKIFNLSHIKIVDLFCLQKTVKNWNIQHKKALLDLMKKYFEKDSNVVNQFNRTWPVIFCTLNIRKWEIQKIKELINLSSCGFEATRLRKFKDLAGFAFNATFDYLAYNQLKRDVRLMEKNIPFGIKLTVTPKKGSFGVWWIEEGVHILPYYGYPLVKKGKFYDIVYAYDAIRLYSLSGIYLKNYSNEPFYYKVD